MSRWRLIRDLSALSYLKVSHELASAAGLLPNVGPPEGRVFRHLARQQARLTPAGVAREAAQLVADYAPCGRSSLSTCANLRQLFSGVGKGQEQSRVQDTPARRRPLNASDGWALPGHFARP